MTRDVLPQNWMRVQLGDVLSEIVGGGTPSKDREDYFQGDIPLMTVKDMKSTRPSRTGFNITPEALANSSAKLVPADTLIVATRMGLGKIVRASFETAINQDLKALFPADGINKSFLEFWYLSIAQRIEAMGTGTTVKGIRLNGLTGLDFPLPPTEEQRRIVEKIEMLLAQLDKGEEAVRQVQALLKRYGQSILKAAVTGALTADWRAENRGGLEHGRDLLARILDTRRATWSGRGRYKEPAAPDTSDLPDLPEGWVWATVEQLSGSGANSLCIGPFGSNLKVSDYAEGGVPLVFVRHIRAEDFSGLDLKYVSELKAKELAAHRVFPGDLLITKMGDPPGDVCIYPTDLPSAIITADCIRMNPASEGVVVGYLEQAMRSQLVQSQIKAISKGVAQQKVTLANFKKVAVPLPPVEEQQEISHLVVGGVKQADMVVETIAIELTRSSALRHSILKQAFSGRLVPQDPVDEPASDLLARIRAAEPVKRNRKAKA